MRDTGCMERMRFIGEVRCRARTTWRHAPEIRPGSTSYNFGQLKASAFGNQLQSTESGAKKKHYEIKQHERRECCFILPPQGFHCGSADAGSEVPFDFAADPALRDIRLDMYPPDVAECGRCCEIRTVFF